MKQIRPSETSGPIKDSPVAKRKTKGVSKSLEAMEIAERRYRLLFETANDGILLVDSSTRKVLDANPAFQRMSGYSHQELTGKSIASIGLRADKISGQKILQRLRENVEVRYENLPLKDRDGEVQKVEVVAGIYWEGDRSVIQYNIRDISERRRAEDALERLSGIVSSSEDAIISKDLDGTITSWNAGAQKIFGYTAEEMMGQSIMRLIPEDRRDEESRILGRIRAGKKVEHFETFRLTKEKRLVELSVSVAPIRDRQGRIVGASKTARDITGRRHQEIALNRLGAIVEHSADAIISKDLNGIVTSWNTGAEKIFGYKTEEIVGESIMRLIPEDRQHEEFRILSRIRNGRSIQHFETVRKTKDGRLIDISVTVSPIKDARGKIVGASKVARDITSRKRTDISLNLLAAIISSSEDAIVSKDLNGIVTSWNAGAENIFGYTAEEMVGQSIMRLIPEDRQHEEYRILSRIKSGRKIRHFETLRRTKDGGLIDVSVTVSPIKDADGRIVGASKVARDITLYRQRKEAQRRILKLATSNQKLEKEILRRQELEKALLSSRQEQEHLKEQVKRLAQQALGALEDERLRISRELHDQVSQTLIGANALLTSLLPQVKSPTPRTGQQLKQVQKLLEGSAATVHDISLNMRPLLLDDLGLIAALRAFLKSFMLRTGIRTSLVAFAKVDGIERSLLTVLYRVCQEALNNVHRHAKASAVEVKIENIGNRVRMTITDNGQGCEVDPFLKAKRGKRLGLIGMRERLEMVGGEFKIHSPQGAGTTILAEIPL
jgi:PAS domain S-box-containing protein